jgi:uncharacterized protein YacL
MLLYFIRALFIIIIVGVLFANTTSGALAQPYIFYVFVAGLAVAVTVVIIDWLTPKKSLRALAGLFFGLLVGILISWALAPVVGMVNEVFYLDASEEALRLIKWIMGICICYLVISIVIRTKDDVRFVIPYVEFAKQRKGSRPLVLDTSVIIDGRIADLCETKLFDAPLLVPRFVLNELQLMADSPDRLKRNRARRGLDMLNKLQSNSFLDVSIDDTPVPAGEEEADVDHKLVTFTKSCDGRLVTNDFNLGKVAQLREVDVVNINDIANAVKPIVLPGEALQVKIIKPGEEEGQGVGYMEDGTMIVVEAGRDKIGKNIIIAVTSSLQTSAGRMIFGRYEQDTSTIRDDNGNRAKNRKDESPGRR